ncbi:uncharacterized protein LOC124352937 isoform X1 [Homalodisca vitripennis]|uniref:uncharacterized protein LOC124352937 isoform X1 n=1 Tax=Homalodisca vitripennis TaxID=197043 RepID=UPI001EEB08BB|nr:uncharacterized protein LOC124352937 isoform X1 [Homalodisca vitripennis]
MTSEGKNKRRFNWKDANTNKKFHGTREYNNEFNNGPVWEEAYGSQSSYQKSYGRPNRSWGRGRNHCNRYQHNRYNNNNFQQPQAFTLPILTEPLTEPEEGGVSGPGSESERLEKILATKKRLEEALASKPSDGSHQGISFRDSSKNTERVKTSENILEVTGVDLRLTNSDFKEIGSVVTNVAAEGEVEGNDIILNTSHCISQQRSFDTACPNPPSTSSKTPRVGGWSVSALNELISSEEPVHTNLPKTGGEMYFQETRERILGNVQSSSTQQSLDNPPRQSAPNTSYQQRNKFSRVGRLYQSFLKSRLCGYTLKMRDKIIKPSGPNPFLDKSVLDNTNANDIEKESATSIGNKILELQMPRPIPVKMEDNGGARVNTPEDIAAEEANEFCKEYSFLLTHPNYLIPPEDLEKFGLGHLSEMTRLLNERRNDGINTPPIEDQDNPLRVRSLNALNSVTEQDITFNQPVNKSHSNTLNVSTPSTNIYNSREQEPGGVISHKQYLSSGSQQHNLFNDLRNQSPNSGFTFSLPQVSTRSNVSSDTNNVIIQTVVERVMEELSKSANTNSQIPNLSRQNQSRDTSHSSIVTNYNEPISSTSKQSSTHLQGNNDKLLKLFLIDKQIENLRQEKMKIYNEMLSSKEISSTVLNCWAQDQIQQGNFRNLITNSNVHLNTSTISEVSEVTNKSIQENNLLVPLGGTFNKSCLQEAVLELAELKKEDATSNKLGGMRVEACLPNSIEPHEIFNSTPVGLNVDNSVPKLSVRKDLHDPNITRRLCDEENVLKDRKTEESSSELSSKSSKDNIRVKNSVQQKKEKKKNKKKKKKGEADCVIDLVGDTSEEETCSISQEGSVCGIDPLAPDDTHPRSLENCILNNDPSGKSPNGSVLLPENYNATCMTTLNNIVIVGTKEGHLIGFSQHTLKQRFCKEIHSDSIICLQRISDYLMTGSADSTISILTMAKQSKKISVLQIPETAPVMCLECRFGYVYGGTKTGFMVVYKCIMKETQTIEVKKINVKKLTNSSIMALRAVKVESDIHVIVASRGEQITVRSAFTGAVIRTFDWCDTVYCLKLHKKSTSVYCGTNTKGVKVVDYVSGENVHDCQVGRAVVKIAFSRNVMFAACYDGKVYFYDLENQKLINSLVVSKGIIVNMIIFKGKIFVVDNKKELHAVPFPEELKLHFNTNGKD